MPEEETSDDGMTLAEFTGEVIDTLASFREMWRAGSCNALVDDPAWPERMNPSDWWEQLLEHDPEDQ